MATKMVATWRVVKCQKEQAKKLDESSISAFQGEHTPASKQPTVLLKGKLTVSTLFSICVVIDWL